MLVSLGVGWEVIAAVGVGLFVSDAVKGEHFLRELREEIVRPGIYAY